MEELARISLFNWEKQPNRNGDSGNLSDLYLMYLGCLLQVHDDEETRNTALNILKSITFGCFALMKAYKYSCSGRGLRGIPLASLRFDRLQRRICPRVWADQEDAADGRARHQQARRHRRPLHQLERLHQDPPETVTDVQEEEEEEMTCVEMIDATTGPARHLIPHANDNQTNSKRPLHKRYITDSRDSPEVNS